MKNQAQALFTENVSNYVYLSLSSFCEWVIIIIVIVTSIYLEQMFLIILFHFLNKQNL